MNTQTMLAFAWNPALGIPMLVIGLIVLGLIWLFGQPKKEQGVRRPTGERATERREPVFGEDGEDGEPAAEAPFSARDEPREPGFGVRRDGRPAQGELDVGLREELERLGATLAGERHGTAAPTSSSAPAALTPAAAPSKLSPVGKLSSTAASIINTLRAPPSEDGEPLAPTAAAIEPAGVAHAAPATPAPPPAVATPPRSEIGRRPVELPVERIVSLFVVAREGHAFTGADLVVAAEKAGLEYGDMGIYHRMLDGKPELGPIFSVANMVKPGNFDLSRVEAMRTPGISFFMTLPAPIPALDAWDAMLPTVQRLAELLDGHVLDEERNALGRQRIAHIRDELRGWDRDHEGKEIIFGR